MPQQECRDNLVFFAKLNTTEGIKGKLPLTEVVGNLEADYEYVTNVGTKAVFRTNKNAPNFKLIATDFENYQENGWSELIAEHSRNVLDWATAVNKDKLVVCYIEDVKVDIILFFSMKRTAIYKKTNITHIFAECFRNSQFRNWKVNKTVTFRCRNSGWFFRRSQVL